MSFVNLMASDVWSEADIVARTEAMIASEFPLAAAAILNRKATGALLGQYQMSDAEKAELARYAAVCDEARAAGNAARQDAALLAQALALETARQRLALPEVGPEDEQRHALDADERAQALQVIESASEGAIHLVELRRPPVLGPTDWEQR